MPSVNWNMFKGLPGSEQFNFEMLCRALIRARYARHGRFIARANQPGVEFHLVLHTTCSLGDSGRWFGWQCRWYDLPGGKALSASRREKIVKSMRTTEKELPGMTDWVLWTKQPLTKGDQDWYYGLNTQMRLHLWTAAEVEEHLSGDAEILRSTYFGELILTSETLKALHVASVARVKHRWIADVHQTVEAERMIRQMLGESQAWTQLQDAASRLKSAIIALTTDLGSLPELFAEEVRDFSEVARTIASSVGDIMTLIGRGDLDLLRQHLETRLRSISQRHIALPRKLRAIRARSVIVVTNALSDIRLLIRLSDRVDGLLGTRLVAILAGAGSGKTQLACQLTSSSADRPAGILLHGKDLSAGHNLNHLANGIVIPGNPSPIPSIEALLGAVDAAGQRSRCRIPIVIDGLNEAEDPRDWKGHLSSLEEMLGRYPYVMAICTLRHQRIHQKERLSHDFPTDQNQEPSFADQAVPDRVQRVDMPDFGLDTLEAIRRYFAYYRIDPTDAELPFELLRHPLTLRLFCEVTNPNREKQVGMEAMPWSLTGLFERYLDQVTVRVAELAPRSRRYGPQDIRITFDQIGWALWEEKSRNLDLKFLQKRIGEDAVLWNYSIIRALEEDGVLLRDPGKPPLGSRIAGVYDSLSGHLVAKAILSRVGRDGIEEWLKTASNRAALTGPYMDRHPLSTDIFNALVGLVPRLLNGRQLWVLLEDPLRTAALRKAVDLETIYLDNATVTEIGKLLLQPSLKSLDLFGKLQHTRSSPSHSLNAEFLDSILRPMSMPDRDLRWTEWIRLNRDELLSDLHLIEERWQNRSSRAASDRLRARWIMWTLTSTVRSLRDQATRTLYWFGRGDPSTLFEIALDSLAINDPYVAERMLAASYGIAMALHGDPGNQNFREKTLPHFAGKLQDAMFAKNAPYSTTHALMRDYARHIIELAILHNPHLFKTSERKRTILPFRDGGIRKWGKHDGFGEKLEFSYEGPLQMDFANYTLGRLVPDRRNYDFNDTQYKDVVKNLHWRLVQLGYSPTIFGEIDKTISSDNWKSRLEESAGRVDRYGKKYSWIAFYELYGFRHDKGLLESKYYGREERPSDVDIDPSFPKEPNNCQVIAEDWLGDRSDSLVAWIERGELPDILPYLLCDEVNGVNGPWVLLDGFVTQVDEESKRGMFAFPRGFLVAGRHAQGIVNLLGKQKIAGHRLPEIPTDHYTFVGEIPWSDTYPKNGWIDFELQVGNRSKRVSRDELDFFRQGKKLNRDDTERLLNKIRNLNSGQNLNNKQNRNDALQELLTAETVTIRAIKKWSTTTEPVYEARPVLIPVRESGWESYHSGLNPGQNVAVPAREIAEAFGLLLRPPSWDMYDPGGRLAALSIKWGNLWLTGHRLCYLRKDLLDRFLRQNRIDLLWHFWGEREIRLQSWEHREEIKKFKHWRKLFQRVYRYRRGQIISGRYLRHYVE